ncbi:MAG: hypothetical protein ACLUQW_08130 [Collinsella sp.]
MNEQVCKADMGGGGAAGVEACGYPVETTGNAVLDTWSAVVHARFCAR